MKSKTISPLFFIFTMFLAFLLSPLILANTQAYASENVVYFDDFSDGVINNFLEVKNYTLEDSGSFGPYGELNLSETAGELKINGVGTISSNVVFVDGQFVGWIGKSLVLKEKMSATSMISVEAKVKVIQGTDFQLHLTIEFDPDNRIIFNLGNKDFRRAQLAFDEFNNVRCAPGPGSPVSCPTTPYFFTDNQLLTLKLDFDPSSRLVKTYIDGNLIIQDTFNGNLSESMVGLVTTIRIPGNSVDARFDDFKVTGQLANQPLPVPDLKQYSDLWGDDTYNFADSWFPSNPTIARWGCALTSASMILKYHGHDINPDALNEWLKAQKDGYTRNGGVMWPAITRLTSLRHSIDSNWPTLEFRYLNYSDSLAKSEIDENRPPILKLDNETYGGNHFIVGKGYNDDNILVNDPGNASNSTLGDANSYWGDTVKLGRFTPSNTDLSYIALFVNENIDLQVASPSGDILGEEFHFKERPMLDPINPNPSSVSGVETLNAFFYPKPPEGLYEVQLTGNGDFQLDSYLYDVDGNVEVQNISNTLPDDETNYYFILISEEGSNVYDEKFADLLKVLMQYQEDGKIKINGVYNFLVNHLTNSNNHYLSDNLKVSTKLLKDMVKHVEFFGGFGVIEEPELLTGEIEWLIDSL